MKDSRDETGKREKLVAAAVICLHRHGYARMTLAQVAGEAGIPAGNIYYYFRTKAELAIAVVAVWQERLQQIFAGLDLLPAAPARLQELLVQWVEARGIYAQYGCPLANLSRDLRGASEPDLAAYAGTVYAGLYDWVRRQFLATGLEQSAAETKTRFLVASLQGGILMAHAQNQAELASEQAAQLSLWLNETLKEYA
jgi:TetR/AcrR family transcriptional repressor of nem operon